MVAATREAYAQGYRFMEAYTPFPVEGLAEALGFHRNGIARIVLLGGLCGGLGGFFMLWYSSVVHFPLDVGGRPFNSWPAFIPITFELTILVAVALGRAGHARAERPAAAASPCVQCAGVSRWRHATGFSCACRPATRCLTSRDLAGFWKSAAPRTISVVPF